jgi:hypothetical protein
MTPTRERPARWCRWPNGPQDQTGSSNEDGQVRDLVPDLAFYDWSG